MPEDIKKVSESLLKQRSFSRRSFIKRTAGTLGLLTVLVSPIGIALKRVKATNETENPTSKEQQRRAWCMVIDLKKCEGCVTLDVPPQCLQVCIQVHYIPKGEKWIEVFEKGLPGGGTSFMPAPCFQCENAPCVNVCPVGATYHDKDGIVLIDAKRCIGCRMCMAACPYQRRFFNWGEPKLPPEAHFIEYSPFYPVPAIKGTVIKCAFCPHLLRDGKLPSCVTGCPMNAIYMGDLNEDMASNGVEVVQLSRLLDGNDAYRYKAELGTQPRVWFLPGHGQEFGRKPDDGRPLIPNEWPWGGDGWNRRPGIWPWGEDF